MIRFERYIYHLKRRTRRMYGVMRRAADKARLRSIASGARLHLGCGTNHFTGWVNVDVDPRADPDIKVDLRFGLPAPTASASFIYSEHVIEHLSLGDTQVLLKDCRRVLAPQGVLRIAMPDLRSLVEHYLSDAWREQTWLQDPVYEEIDSPARMLNYVMREWKHLYLYDENELRLRLEEAGFTAIERREWQISPHPELRALETRPDSLLIMEAVPA